ncbi:MAG: hypothetical protein WDW36_005605 [Sanguina aurantia]
MSWLLLCWLGLFILQAALLGRNIYAIVCFSDLESDFINPFELTSRLNRFVVLEYSGQAAITLAMLLSGEWILAALHGALLLYFLNLVRTRQYLIDTTDVFKQLPIQKKRRLAVFVFYAVLFVFTAYRLIETAIKTALSPEGREMVKKMLHEAAGSLHGY